MNKSERKINPEDIALPEGFAIEAYITDLTTPIDIELADGGMIIGDAGVTDGSGKVLKASKGVVEVIAEGFNPPLTGVTLRGDIIYVAHRGFVTAVMPDGSKKDIISGLPSWGDHHNNKVVFGPDGRMYFGQGTATNSGVVGLDNTSWLFSHPFFHDRPGIEVQLVGRNYCTENVFSAAEGDIAYTGAYSPFGVPSYFGEPVKGINRASGSVLCANDDGSGLTMFAWGLRNPFRMMFDKNGRLLSTDHGMDVRGSRPVANSPDSFYNIRPGFWYGWPDYTGGLPVTMPQFAPDGGPRPEFLLSRHPMNPPLPIATFAPHSAIMGFDFNPGDIFPSPGSVYIAEYGSEAPETTGGVPAPYVGHRVSIIDTGTGKIETFAINKSGVAASETGGGGFERPIDVLFGPDNSLYIADFSAIGDEPDEFMPGTGLIWRVFKKGK